jgi:hypothetical protein
MELFLQLTVLFLQLNEPFMQLQLIELLRQLQL